MAKTYKMILYVTTDVEAEDFYINLTEENKFILVPKNSKATIWSTSLSEAEEILEEERNFSKELVATVKTNTWNVNDHIKKDKFTKERITPLVEELGYGPAVYAMMFLDGEYWGEVVKVYDKNLNLDFMIDVSADSPAGIISDCAQVVAGIKKKMYLTNFVAKSSVEFISARDLKYILEAC